MGFVTQSGAENFKGWTGTYSGPHSYGGEFSSLGDGRISLGKEGGHSKRRVLHVKDVTGKAIEEALLANIAKQGVDLFEHYFAIDLITSKKLKKLGMRSGSNTDRVEGIYFLDAESGEVITVKSPRCFTCHGWCRADLPLHHQP